MSNEPKMKATMTVPVPVEFSIDGQDVVLALNGNDESVLAFVLDMLREARSSDLRERLAACLSEWPEWSGDEDDEA